MNITNIIRLMSRRIAILTVASLLTMSTILPVGVSANDLETSADEYSSSASAQATSTDPASSAETLETEPPTTQATDAPITKPEATENVEVESPIMARTTTPEELSAGEHPETTQTAVTDTEVANTITSGATSGDAAASENTTVETIETGSATAVATIVNTLQSSLALSGGSQPIVFVYDVPEGDVIANLVIDPSALAASSTESTSALAGGGVALSALNNAAITNDIAVSAESGDASALQNTTVGDISTGNTQAVANVINLINSAIQANQSFIGIINIHGNLTGDILLPEAFVNSLLAAYESPENTNDTPLSLIATDENASITNNIRAVAGTGSATAESNTTTGNLQTGDASTNVTLINLTGKSVVGSNALLVFVNVLGNWVGLIFDAPVGSTSAAIGSGGGGLVSGASGITSRTNMTIENNIVTSALSGNASAEQNTTVGAISSGNAQSGVNLLNIVNSQLSLTDWFGVLFINVFGNWYGSVATLQANTQPTVGGSGQNPSATSSAPADGQALGAVFSVLETQPGNTAYRTLYRSTDNTTQATTPRVTETLSDSIENTATTEKLINLSSNENSDDVSNTSAWVWVGIGSFVLAGTAVGRYYYIKNRSI